MRDFKFVATDTKRERHRFKVVDVETDKAVVHSVASYETPEAALEDYQAVYGWIARTSLLNRNAAAENARLDTELQAALTSLDERDKVIKCLEDNRASLEAQLAERDATIAKQGRKKTDLKAEIADLTQRAVELTRARDAQHRRVTELTAAETRRRRTLRYRLFGWLSG